MSARDSLRAHARRVLGSDRDTGAYVYVRDSFFATVADACAVIEETVGLAHHNNEGLRAQAKDRAEGSYWAFGAYHTQAAWRQAMLDGDKAGAARVASFQGSLSAALVSPVSARRKPRKGPQGDELCVHAALRGQLDRAWQSRTRVLGRAPAPIAILVPMSSNAGSSADSFAWRAAAALALAGPMQRAGYKVTILAADALRNCFEGRSKFPRRLGVFHRVADGGALDIPRVSACLSAPHLRLLSFMVAACAPWQCDTGLGHAEYDPAEYLGMATAAGVIRPNEDVLIVPPRMHGEVEARTWLAQVSKQYGQA